MTSENDTQPAQEAPHFTKELLLGALHHLRGDLEASLSGEGGDDRARSRLAAARKLGLDRLAPETIEAFDRAYDDVTNLAWPGGLDNRYVALSGALNALTLASTELMAHNDKNAHLTDLAGVVAKLELASASGFRRRTADALRGLCVIVDPEQTNGRDAAWVAEQALEGGATAILLRVKNPDKGAWLDLASRISETCESRGAALIVNDHPDVAVAVRASGVLVGRHDLPLDRVRTVLRSWQIAGTSNTLVDDAAASLANGADYIGVSIANSQALGAVRPLVPADGPPVVAIGAITTETAGEFAAAGADGICVQAVVSSADDPQATTAALLSAFRG
jgi:thiamine-phosphate pyrophosphorylase